MALLTIILFGLLVRRAYPQAAPEGQAAACDNNRAGKSKTVDHTCECARAMTMCDPQDPEIETPGAMCKTYCRPDKCDCQNKCTS